MEGVPMPEECVPHWLAWARELQALGQTGLTYAKNEYDVHNFTRLSEIAAEIVREQTGLETAPTLETFKVQPGYATPKVDVRGAIIRDDRILLVQESADRRWCMPGGWADIGARPAEMIVREVEEESGYVVEPYKVIGVFDANRGGRPIEFFHAYKVVWLCHVVGGQQRTSHETLAVKYFSFDDLPPLSIHRTDKRHLAEVRKHIEDPDRQAAFD
jgi:ADP-ribose pyrophosphatase YjhB (NUDIX family)